MNKEKYARVCVVLDLETDRALRHISAVTHHGISEIVRELIAEPVGVLSRTLAAAESAKTPADRDLVLDQIDMFVEGAYGSYLQQRSATHG